MAVLKARVDEGGAMVNHCVEVGSCYGELQCEIYTCVAFSPLRFLGSWVTARYLDRYSHCWAIILFPHLSVGLTAGSNCLVHHSIPRALLQDGLTYGRQLVNHSWNKIMTLYQGRVIWRFNIHSSQTLGMALMWGKVITEYYLRGKMMIMIPYIKL